MAGIKRKSAAQSLVEPRSKSKKAKVEKHASKRTAKDERATHRSKKPITVEKSSESDDLVESDTSGDENGFYGFAADEEAAARGGSEDEDMVDAFGESSATSEPEHDDYDSEEELGTKKAPYNGNRGKDIKSAAEKWDQQQPKPAALNASSSRESHQKQRALAKERKAAKTNADIIERSKKLWEQLRLKSHVEKETRKKLVEELFEIVTGRVKDFVFKHDSARVIQCALKYATPDQRRMIARELQGEYRTLAEGKYSKHLVAKLLEKNDPQIRDMVIAEFYGHVRRMINHPEAAWILDDTYRQVATPEQKRRLLCEWYGPEFSIAGLKSKDSHTAELNAILEKSPEKRKPIMDYLDTQINQIIQKKQHGFTMLHDAMLQYFLACKPGSEEANNLFEHFRPDPTVKEGEEADNVDILKNLAFTKSGSRLVSLAFAYGSAKDRKVFLKPYKDVTEMMAYDVNAHHVLLTVLAVMDDTKLSSKSIFGDLLPSNDTLPEKVLNLVSSASARSVLLYPYASESKWLLDDKTKERLSEIYAIRETTSKKNPNTRLQELAKFIEPQLLSAITTRVADLVTFSFGLQFIGEVLVGAPEVEQEKRKEALTEIANHCNEIFDPSKETSSAKDDPSTFGKGLLKTLVQGGKYNPQTRSVVPVDPPLGFADMFWEKIKADLTEWATGPGSFVIVGLAESEDFSNRDKLLKAMRKSRTQLETAAGTPTKKNARKNEKGEIQAKGNPGARLLLEKL
ncbi:ARM repeat-containing protein [Polyplosphaeria fusca]|uniref:ARM repeat-containing protein n=1 Tax=Polyplosphaeria fusca TaxID=682080 RepID=A0A9P4V3T6_9PLEO|nr:ARM repeat-containing protein [Polyplosphaeria fusca]